MSAFDSAAFLKNLTSQPGVYRMYNAQEEVIYVGKAKNLKKRVSSYFRMNVDNAKTRSLVMQIANMDVTVVNSETEAFLLENNFIKKYKPRYNVVMRDDKSYPFIFLSDHQHPRLSFHRGPQKKKGEYFGPYPSAGAVRESLRSMQRIFPVRQCEDSYYRARSRPCLQYQMQRCSAPCVEGYVSDEEYNEQIDLARLFLKGKNQQVIGTLVDKMEKASEALNFEAAARYRDQINTLRKVQERQWVAGTQDEMDVFGFAVKGNMACIQVMFIRDSQLLGSKAFFPKVPNTADEQEIFESFLLQFYLAGNKLIPKQMVFASALSDEEAIADLLSGEAGYRVNFFKGAREEKRRYLELAQANAETALEAQYGEQKSVFARYLDLETALELDAPLQRMECFDISHTSGEQTVASCVVFNREGPLKSDYRRYNIEGITPGDDYAAMAQALKRRYKSVKEVQKIPDLLLIDGGKGQLSQAETFFEDWPHDKKPMLLGVAKGTTRKPGLETIILADSHDTVPMDSHSPALHLIQHIRDESHRFAITGHRNRRQKVKTTSSLETIPGVGAKRRQTLLKYMGGLQGLKKASKDEIASVPGISKELADTIYDHLHL
ncbi:MULTISPECIES: excinuclease ABC subunit UvrC [Alteromonas]|jgi:excinuclease ABC subunit C|uniref:UvrABC system protein C n=2 Tax=Alteromonas stellipolaris TaxID=233316 RepID=A0ABM5YI27_9ALTE|nr:excinuclease ABC subunit UvrC [Alteromonas stellipolaris]AMJ73676.1 excinuclease ABC subunit C [Alteromonas stellipolaris]AMJ93806.1 excinuclease ABC subunit C [Alteromonas stellipolaris]ANB22502.1 excinuclease ABC subunit C [Alteromonas stellipolaris]ANB27189.1 excinuclease ABC subunit C [Alteromonas stellipolaris]MBZ2162411.1 excinuclease ABC subunit UvrC [Alteromonas stellipolaris]